MQEIILLTQPNEHANIISSRNLRAKIRSMLPQNQCQKHKKRSKRLLQVSEKKHEQDKYLQASKYLNTCGKQNKTYDYFFEHFRKQPTTKEIFTKLKIDEIEKICQNKHYYLGNAYTQTFNTFLKLKQDKNNRSTKAKSIKYRTVPEQNSLISQIQLFKTLQKLPTMKSNENIKTPQKNQSRKISKAQQFRNRRQSIYQKYKSIITADQICRNHKQKYIESKLLKAESNVKYCQQKFKRSIEKRHQNTQKVKQKIKQLYESSKEQSQLNRLALQLKKICGDKNLKAKY